MEEKKVVVVYVSNETKEKLDKLKELYVVQSLDAVIQSLMIGKI